LRTYFGPETAPDAVLVIWWDVAEIREEQVSEQSPE
jgi:hypothetical protein